MAATHYLTDEEEYQVAMGWTTREALLKEHEDDYQRDPLGHLERNAGHCYAAQLDWEEISHEEKRRLGELAAAAQIAAEPNAPPAAIELFKKLSAELATWKDDHDGGRWMTEVPGWVKSPRSPPGTIHYLTAYFANGKRLYITADGADQFKDPATKDWCWTRQYYSDNRGSGHNDTVQPYESGWQRAQSVIMIAGPLILAVILASSATGGLGAEATAATVVGAFVAGIPAAAQRGAVEAGKFFKQTSGTAQTGAADLARHTRGSNSSGSDQPPKSTPPKRPNIAAPAAVALLLLL